MAILSICNGKALNYSGELGHQDIMEAFYDAPNSPFAKTSFSTEDFYLFLSASVSFVKDVAVALNEKYEEDKIKYYALAKNSSVYDKVPKLEESLETEINIKRFLGLFIAAESSMELSQFIVDTFIKHYPELSKALDGSINKAIIKNNFLKAPSDRPNTTNVNCKMIMPFMALYIALTKHDIGSSKIWALVMCANNYIAYRNMMIANVKKKSIDTSWSDRGYVHKTEKRRAIEALSNTKFVGTLIDLINAIRSSTDLDILPKEDYEFLTAFFENIYTYRFKDGVKREDIPVPESGAIDDDWVNKCLKLYEEDADGAYALQYLSIFDTLAEQFDYSPTVLFGEREITSDLRKRFYAIIVEFRNIAHLMSNDNCYFPFSLYLLTVLFYVLFEELAKQKELYFKYNSETQYFALHDLETKIGELERVIEELTADKETLATVIAEYDNKLAEVIATPKTVVKDISKEAIATYEASISAKDKEIEKLKLELERERAKNKEVDRLREVVFEFEMPDLPESKVSLAELIDGKKIVVIGGHINWQNKMKAAYPDMIIIDGHLANVDTALFKDVDLVLFNTANMSHKLYYKLIDVFRFEKVKYDYLGRVTNSALLEKEIAYLIQKNL